MPQFPTGMFLGGKSGAPVWVQCGYCFEKWTIAEHDKAGGKEKPEWHKRDCSERPLLEMLRNENAIMKKLGVDAKEIKLVGSSPNLVNRQGHDAEFGPKEIPTHPWAQKAVDLDGYRVDDDG